jgi:hypothetical protein
MEQQQQGGLAPRDIRAAWNDGYSAAVSNAQDAGLITEEQSYDLLEELSRLED